MAAVTTQSRAYGTLTTPAPITPTAADTVAEGQFGPLGITIRIITTGTATTLTVTDPNPTAMGSVGTPAAHVAPSTGAREAFIPRSAINPATGLATLNFSGALTGVTYELYKG